MNIFDTILNKMFTKTFDNLAPQNYKEISKAEKDIDKGRTINLGNMQSKRYTYGTDIGMDKSEAEKLGPLSPGEKTNLKKSGRTGLYTAKQMHESDIDTSAENRPEDVDERNIDSTAIQDLKYNPETKIAEVTFRGGSHSYAYPDVPEQNIKDMIRAPSKGIAFGKEIKPYAVKGFRGHA